MISMAPLLHDSCRIRKLGDLWCGVRRWRTFRRERVERRSKEERGGRRRIKVVCGGREERPQLMRLAFKRIHEFA